MDIDAGSVVRDAARVTLADLLVGLVIFALVAAAAFTLLDEGRRAWAFGVARAPRLGGYAAERITGDAVRAYQLFRRAQGAEAATINRETSALSRMWQLAMRRGVVARMPVFPDRLRHVSKFIPFPF